ncbi:hypothetical protein NQ095_19240 [Rossellomorea sp. SC111]|uniref:hypothetical protein n=1 Tax=Rossellomorea sp. SC111 TaxID=2968985 RepID=UPI00215B217D|nr:hypothetical protein [Rossellomorea sp. SC111]MCR8850559.1 hypothetical protein [Rossellomorea sp. SC111]
MKKKVVLLIAVFILGTGFGSIMTVDTKANTSTVLASVEWVISKITPMENRINELEDRVDNLSSGGGNTPETPVRGTSDVITTTNTSVKRGASAGYEDMVVVPKGTILSYYDTYKNSITNEKWYLVKLSNGKVGAVLSQSSTIDVDGDTSTYAKVVINENTPARRGASKDYAVYQTLTTNTVLTYISTYKDPSGQGWYIIKLSDGRSAAILSDHAEVAK